MVVLQEWHRQHADDSRSVITELPDGTFAAKDLATGRERRAAWSGQLGFESIEDARCYVEEGALARGHRCGDECGTWVGSRVQGT